MEDELDAISRADMNHIEFLVDFYNGTKDRKGLNDLIEQEFNKTESKQIMILEKENCDNIALKIGRYGIYLERGEEKANLGEEIGPENISYDIADEMLKNQSKEDECIGKMNGEDILIKNGRFGSYLKCGDKTKGFPPGITSENVDETVAIKILSLPTVIGNNEEGEDIKIDIGKYGPYIRCGKNTKSIPPEKDMFTLSEKEAIEILSSKQSFGKSFND